MAVYLENLVKGVELLKEEQLKLFLKKKEKGLLNIGILNLMPTKYETEAQLLRLLSRAEYEVKVHFLRLESHKTKNVPHKYVLNNYRTIDEIGTELDGVIVTGAPVEKLNFNEVTYIGELKVIFDFIKSRGISTIFICWGAQAALNHYYGIRKSICNSKIFGVFPHKSVDEEDILKGISKDFFAPHSRHTSLVMKDVERCNNIKLLSFSEEAGEYIIRDENSFYILGHCEYDRDTLKREYFRDISRGIEVNMPKNYFEDNNPDKDPIMVWRNDAEKLYNNWLKYYVSSRL